MKEGTTLSLHLNEFHSIFSQLTNQRMNFDDEVKAIFLLSTLPDSWDTFATAISNSAPAFTGLSCQDVESALLQEEVRRKNSSENKNASALAVG